MFYCALAIEWNIFFYDPVIESCIVSCVHFEDNIIFEGKKSTIILLHIIAYEKQIKYVNSICEHEP